MKQYTFAVLALIAGSAVGFGQSLPEAIKKTDNERYEEAAKDFKALLNNSTVNSGDVYFFYGENFFQADDVDSAKVIWQKGVSNFPDNHLSIVGKGKATWLSGDTAGASAIFNDLLKVTKRRNAEIIRQIASVYVYSPVKNLNKGVSLLNEAIKLEPKNQFGYLIMGDAQVEINPRNSSEAMKYYNQAGDITSNARVFVRKAKIYQRAQNPKLADSLYQVAQDIEPAYAPSYRERAELNMRYGQTDQSVTNWQKYLKLNDSEQGRYRYATSLFVGKKYAETIEQINVLESRGFQNLFTARMLAYATYENAVANNGTQSDYENGLKSIENFFKIAPEDKVLGSDYKYKALYNQKLGKEDLYLKGMEEAADFDKTIAGEVYGDLAKYYMKDKNYDMVIQIYNKKMGSDSSKLSLAEYYELGRAYYFNKNFEKSDLAHAKVLSQAPDYALSHLWRGRSSVQIEAQKAAWTPKGHYEKFIGLLTPEDIAGQYKSMAIEALKYLGDFYVNSPEKNIEKAKEVWTQVKALSPDDSQAKAFFATVK